MVQRTFTLIPQFPGRASSPDRQPARPMTSKQVQKAYKAANRGPRLSRAEAWKQERAEQERIRKEFEKEKSAAKAKVAREKKKQKELAEKEQKRQKGLPLVSVRPSQDTIARFVRGNGTARKRDAEGRDARKVDTIQEEEEVTPETSREATAEEEDGAGEPTLKKPRLENVQEAEESTRDGGLDAMAKDPPRMDSLETRRLDNIQEMEDDTADAAERSAMENESRRSPPQAPNLDILGIEEDDLDTDFEEDLALELLVDLEAAVVKQSAQGRHPEAVVTDEPSPILKPSTPHQRPGAGRHPTNRYEQDLGLRRPTPPAPVAQPSPAQRLHQTPASPSPSPPRQAPPMSTQAILSNFDDFFPSPSQQARELEEELFDNIAPSAPTPARRLPPIDEIEEEELEEELDKPADPAPSPVLDPAPDSPPGPQRRFFTSSGSHELMCLALHRSRRTAALEQIQRREQERMQEGMILQAEAESLEEARRHQLRKARLTMKDAGNNKPKQQPPQLGVNSANCEKPKLPGVTSLSYNNGGRSPKQIQPPEPAKAHTREDNKENQRPLPDETFGPSASQESYGGDWVDEIALELMI
ncbi:hypothetical protein ACJ41O_000683 [Fusarium nematophilum]